MNKKVPTLLLITLLLITPITQATSYYYAGSKALASTEEDGTINYQYHDRLGTETETDTLPFGQTIIKGDRLGFTGKEQDSSELHYFGARYYDTNTGRFTSIDPIEESYPYQYVHNDPTNYVDPTGKAVAVVMDDVSSLQHANKIIELKNEGKMFITPAIMPNSPDSKKIARAFEKAGIEYGIHLPMEPKNPDRKGVSYNTFEDDQKIAIGTSRAEIGLVINWALEQVPGASFINNHEGSAATSDSETMLSILSVLDEKGITFLDSRTQVGKAQQTVSNLAQVFSIPVLRRNGPFISDWATKKEEVSKRLNSEIGRSENNLDEIRIGITHPGKGTFDSFENLPKNYAKDNPQLFVPKLNW